MATDQTAGIDFRQYLVVLRRHILVIFVLTLAFGVAGYAYASSQTPMYEASALLLYQPQLDITDPLGGSGYGDTVTQELQLQSATTIIGGTRARQACQHAASAFDRAVLGRRLDQFLGRRVELGRGERPHDLGHVARPRGGGRGGQPVRQGVRGLAGGEGPSPYRHRAGGHHPEAEGVPDRRPAGFAGLLHPHGAATRPRYPLGDGHGQLRVRHPRDDTQHALRAAAHQVGDHGRRLRAAPGRRVRAGARETEHTPAQLSRSQRADGPSRRGPHPGDPPGQSPEGTLGGGHRSRGASRGVAEGAARQHRIRQPRRGEPHPHGRQRPEGRGEEPRHRQSGDVPGALGQEGRRSSTPTCGGRGSTRCSGRGT